MGVLAKSDTVDLVTSGINYQRNQKRKHKNLRARDTTHDKYFERAFVLTSN